MLKALGGDKPPGSFLNDAPGDFSNHESKGPSPLRINATARFFRHDCENVAHGFKDGLDARYNNNDNKRVKQEGKHGSITLFSWITPASAALPFREASHWRGLSLTSAEKSVFSILVSLKGRGGVNGGIGLRSFGSSGVREVGR